MKKKANITESGKLSQAQEDSLKKTHGNIHEMWVWGNDEETEKVYGYLKPIDRRTFGAVSSIIQMDPVKGCEMILSNCWLSGDERIKNDDDCFFAAMPQMVKIVKIRGGGIKKK